MSGREEEREKAPIDLRQESTYQKLFLKQDAGKRQQRKVVFVKWLGLNSDLCVISSHILATKKRAPRLMYMHKSGSQFKESSNTARPDIMDESDH